MNYVITAAGQIKTGTDSVDFFTLQTGNNVKVFALGGNDIVYVQSSVDAASLDNESYISLGGGADSIYVEDWVESSTILGGAGGDTIRVSGSIYNSLVAGGDGSDLITIRGAYNSTVRGGNGADTLEVGTRNIGYSQIQMGAGADLVIVGSSIYESQVTLGGGADTLIVSSHIVYSQIDAGAGADSIYVNGRTYSSVIQGGGNSDTIILSAEVDYSTIRGGAGGDLIVGEYDFYSSRIYGDAGNDTIVIEGRYSEYNRVYGGDGADSIFMSASVFTYSNTIWGGAGADTIELTRRGAQYIGFTEASESNISNYDKVMFGESAGLYFEGITVTGVYSYGNINTVVSTNDRGYAQFNTAVTDLQGRVTLLDEVLSRGEGVLFDAVVDGSIQRFVFVQGGPSSNSGIQDDYLVQVNNAQGRTINYFDSQDKNYIYLSANANNLN